MWPEDACCAQARVYVCSSLANRCRTAHTADACLPMPVRFSHRIRLLACLPLNESRDRKSVVHTSCRSLQRYTTTFIIKSSKWEDIDWKNFEGIDPRYFGDPRDYNVSSENYTQFMENFSWFLNNSKNFLDPEILNKYAANRNVESPVAFYGLIFAYVILIILGACGNGLVVCAVARKPAMRTARNLFIVNLAVSDMLLCLITMPLTLMEILTVYWPLGSQDFICKMLGTLQATSIFVSTISITAIALDRYHVIVYPTRESLQVFGAIGILGAIWATALILAAPLFVWRTLKEHRINLDSIGLNSITYCLEEWPVTHGRAYYSLFSLIFQYVLPIITVSVAYSRICRKLHYRYVRSNAGARSSCKEKSRKKDDKRMRRTNSLLVSIALIFCISWLPLNIYNLVVDFYNPFGADRQSMMVVYAICHMIGMSSACSNPLLYGWLNDNFRKEFKEILATFCPWIPVEAVQERVNSFRSSLKESRRKRRAQKKGELNNLTTEGAGTGACKSSAPEEDSVAIGVNNSQLLTVPPAVAGPSNTSGGGSSSSTGHAAPVSSGSTAFKLRRAGSNSSSHGSARINNESTQIAYRKALDTTMVVSENISGLTEMTVITGLSSQVNV
ncbi:hypothetical protein B566_EDAN009211 [Ephemera danica]|nr:hypothetical protein B566_EDAN009211 [Ephemera danica]